MRIKRFTAPDMRTALRMVRDEQGPDAVILSNRATPDGIEVVAATDYDEALVAQALRAAAPAAEPPAAPVVKLVQPAKAAASVAAAPFAAQAMRTRRDDGTEAAPVQARAEPRGDDAVVQASNRAKATVAPAPPASAPTAPRESLMTRARAIFRLGHEPADAGPTLAELTGPTAPAPVGSAAVAKSPADAGATAADTSRFESMIAAFNPQPAGDARSGEAVAAEPCADDRTRTVPSAIVAPIAAPVEAVAANDAERLCDADYLISLSTGAFVPAVAGSAQEPAPSGRDAESSGAAPADASSLVAAVRHLHAVAGAETDPAIVAMRGELATMRQLMEKQLEQLSLERLRGSPARAAALDALLAYGCEGALAQEIASRIDPRLPPGEILEPLRAELMARFALAPVEPIENGGVIALVGPTGAGKTTVAAKLAARYAARHRARDVALVSIDRERTGAREQLHAHGRRLGVTVCDAESSDGLGAALDQLQDYPLVLVDTAGYGVRDRALLRQILWLRSSSRLRSLLVLPANAHPLDLGDLVRRYRPAAPEGVVLTKLDETGRPGAALSVLARHDLSLAYTTSGQQVPADLEVADADSLTEALDLPSLEKSSRAADNALASEDRHAFA